MSSPTTHGKGLNIPADGVEFGLKLTTVVEPMEMVRWAGEDPEGWKYTGEVFVPGTQRFKLVQVGYERHLEACAVSRAKRISLRDIGLRLSRKLFPAPTETAPLALLNRPGWARTAAPTFPFSESLSKHGASTHAGMSPNPTTAGVGSSPASSAWQLRGQPFLAPWLPRLLVAQYTFGSLRPVPGGLELRRQESCISAWRRATRQA